MPCSDCRKWLTQRVTDYEDGERIVNFRTPEGKGRCEFLNAETPADFECKQHEEGHEHIEIMGKKTGSPWHHWVYGDCPDCGATGLIHGAGCRRCAQTGRVRFYDDGYVGEQQTCLHPKEKVGMVKPTPKCEGCEATIDLGWVACPHCGHRIRKPDDPTRVSSISTALGLGTGNVT